MAFRDTHSPGSRLRASSDTYTALPPRAVHRDRARLHRPSDATPQSRNSHIRSALSSLPSSVERRAPNSYDAMNSHYSDDRQRAPRAMIGKQEPVPFPPRTYRSPASQSTATFNHTYPHTQPPLRPMSEIRRRGPSMMSPDKKDADETARGIDEEEEDLNRDVFIRAMQLNGELDRPDLPDVDADSQPYAGQDTEKPFFLKNLESDSNGEDDDGVRLSYRDRRKKGKHRIIYNKDNVENQQRFIIVLARALIAFGSPSHRIEPQLASVAALFELPAQFVHTPGCVQMCFGYIESHTTETLLVKADSDLDLGRIHDTHSIYRAVVRDEISAGEGCSRLEEVISREPIYSKKLQFIITFAQGFILCGSSFGGSINDMWVAGLLSLFVALTQLRVTRSQLGSNGADIFIAGVVSFVSRVLSARVPGQVFCYQAISSASVAGLLPGAVMLSGVLDIASKNIYLGSSKLVSGLMTSLYLGFGLTLGSDIWLHFDRSDRNHVASLADRFELFNGTFYSTNMTTPGWLSPTNLTGIWSFQETSIEATHNNVAGCFRDPSWSWWLKPLPWYSLFALLPVLNLVLSMKRAQPLWTIEMPVMIIISCTSTAVTKLANRNMALSGHPDYTALLGSFVVSLLGNLYSRRMGGTAFTIMLTGIWLLIPTGLAEAGGLTSSYTGPGQDEYTESLQLARKMISVIIGVMSGVYLSARLVYAFGKKKNSAFVTF